MIRRIAPAVLALVVALSAPGSQARARIDPEVDRLKRDVYRLASPEFGGRSGDGGRAAGDFLIERLEGLGLKPGFGDRYDQEFTSGTIRGRNIAARLDATPAGRDEDWIILSAHYDHLGIRGGTLYPGADDNATAVAMVLEVARCLVDAGDRPRRTILFVFFDLEEDGLLGSQHFVREPPVPIDRVGLFLTADMLGRSLAGIGGETLFVMGTEHAPELRPWIEDASEALPLRVGLIGADLLVIDRSDYGPFRWRKVPFLFFSTGESPVYHTPEDVPETIDYAKLTAATTLIGRVVLRVASAESLPGWTSEKTPWIGEASTILAIFELLLEHQDRLEIPRSQRVMIGGMADRISRWVDHGMITPEQRTAMVRVAQIVLFTVL